MKNIVVFCGSAPGNDSIFAEQAYFLGKHLAQEGMTLVYGGANVGLMAAVANGVLDNEGKAIGILPHFLKEKELAHPALTELLLVDTMHERKMKMNELSDAVIALPGGFGTMEEFFEMLTWAQLGLHAKPMGLLNINGFYDDLIRMAGNMADKGFLRPEHRDIFQVSDTVPGMIDRLKHYHAPVLEKWIDKEEV